MGGLCDRQVECVLSHEEAEGEKMAISAVLMVTIEDDEGTGTTSRIGLERAASKQVTFSADVGSHMNSELEDSSATAQRSCPEGVSATEVEGEGEERSGTAGGGDENMVPRESLFLA